MSDRSITIELFGPGMTALHKVGLAGLWMTLEALESDAPAMKRLQEAGGSWERTTTFVTLRWDGDPEHFFRALFEESFKLDNNGLLWFPALGAPMNHPQHAVVLQEAILGSFLQHGQTRKADEAQKPQGNLTVEIDDTPLVLRFHRMRQYAHQNAEFSAAGVNRLAGWHYPGGAVRHVGLGPDSTALEEPSERALALRFALIGAVYFEIRFRPRYALVLPEISDLERYAMARSCFLRYGVQQFYSAGTADAGLRVLTELQASGLLDDMSSAFCRVISFGMVPWSPQQKTRIDLFSVRVGSERALRTFSRCRQFFHARLVKPKSGDAFCDVPQMPDLVARNVSKGIDWWKGFADFVANQSRGDHVLTYEKGGLAKMVEDKEAFPPSPERNFVLACHEAWRCGSHTLGATLLLATVREESEQGVGRKQE